MSWTRVSLLSELLIKKELIERMHPISEDLTVEEIMDLKVRMCWPTRCVIWLDIIVYLVQSANTEFKVLLQTHIIVLRVLMQCLISSLLRNLN